MNESAALNESGTGSLESSWLEAEAFDANRTLALSSAALDFHVNPWDIMLCLSGTVIACENAIVVAIIFYTPTLRNPMFILIGSLATADLLAGMGLILNFAFQYLVSSETISLITVGFLVASFTASISSLLAITVDRYLSLYNALTYFSEKTLHYVHLMLVGTWGVSLGLGLLPVLGWNCLDDASTCSIVRPLNRTNLTLLAASFFVIFRPHAHPVLQNLQDSVSPRTPDRAAAAFLHHLALCGHQEGRLHARHHPGHVWRQLAALRHLLSGRGARVSVGVHIRHATSRYLQLYDQPHHLRLPQHRDPALHLHAFLRLLSDQRLVPIQIAQRGLDSLCFVINPVKPDM